MRILRLSARDRPAWQDRLRAFSERFTYPLGDDRFRIDHGPDYFRFFDRCGEAIPFLAVDGDRVVAAACAVLREAPSLGRAWYLCDLKVDWAFKGRGAALSLIRSAMPYCLRRCRRGYAITMLGPGAHRSPVPRLLGRLPLLSFETGPRLEIYSLGLEELLRAAPLLRRHRGSISLESLRGIKDLVLESTGRPMPLWHLRFGAAESRLEDAETNGTFMFCVPTKAVLSRELRASGLRTQAYADILRFRMPDFDGAPIETSDL